MGEQERRVIFGEEKRVSKRKTLAWWTSRSPNDRPKTRSFFAEQDLEVATAATYLATSHRMYASSSLPTQTDSNNKTTSLTVLLGVSACVRSTNIFVGTNNL